MEYKSPGREGSNVLWDFSKQRSINEHYTLLYGSLFNSFIIGKEDCTFYKYLLKNDSLFSYGHENSTSIILNQKPELLLIFPFGFRQKIEDYFFGTGKYCDHLDLVIQGKNTINADAYGLMILPEGDTLNNVLRVHTTKKIVERITPIHIDTHTETYSPDNIEFHLSSDSIWMRLDIYRWYSEGYRYPIFETVENTVYKYQKPYKHFNTAFLYTPESQHYELNNDPDNLTKREKIALKKEKQKRYINNNSPDLKNKINYNIFFNGTGNELSLEYLTTEDMEIGIALFDL